MKCRSKQQLAMYLLDEIGSVEDRFIAEAATPYRPVRSSFPFRRCMILVVSLSLLLCAILGLLIGNQFLSSKKNECGMEAPEDMAGDAEHASVSSLSDSLEMLRSETEHLRIAASDIDLLTETPMVIWKYNDETMYRAKTITSEECTNLLRQLEIGDSSTYSPADSEISADIWLVLGNGQVISPYLIPSSDNIGYGVLLDYQAETEPSPAFTDMLYSILS